MENFDMHCCNEKFRMTDEQVETLRKQIAVYTYISEQLIQRHTHSSSRQHLTNGRMPLLTSERLFSSS